MAACCLLLLLARLILPLLHVALLKWGKVVRWFLSGLLLDVRLVFPLPGFACGVERGSALLAAWFVAFSLSLWIAGCFPWRGVEMWSALNRRLVCCVLCFSSR